MVTGASEPERPGAVTIHPWAELTPEFVPELVELERRVHQASTHYDDAPWQLDNFARALPGKEELSLVMKAAGKPAGFLVASRGPTGIHVHRLAVDPDHWGCGIASALLARLLASSIGVVTLNCDPRNDRALAFYRRAGFRVTGTTSAGKLLLSMEEEHPPAERPSPRSPGTAALPPTTMSTSSAQ